MTKGSPTYSASVSSILAVVGGVYATFLTHRLVQFVWRQLLRPDTDLKKRYKGGWAIVTGGTSGIGKSCAEHLAKAGFHVCLMARTKSSLEDLAQHLEKQYNIQTMAVSIDATVATAEEVDQIVEKLVAKDGTVAILVNSVGILNSRPCNTEEMTYEEAARIIQVNCTFPILLTSKVLPSLRKHASQNGHSAIMNVGSLTSSCPFPMFATYAATKSFNDHWSWCLAAEVAADNVDVLCVRPGLVATPMSGIDKPNFFVPHPDDFAKRALGKLGLTLRSILPHPPHALLDYMATQIMPESIQEKTVLQMHQQRQKEVDEKAKQAK